MNDPHSITAAGFAMLGMRSQSSGGTRPLRVAVRRVDFPIKNPSKYLSFCDQVICISRAVRRVCRKGGLPESRLSLVPDGATPAKKDADARRRGRTSLNLAGNEKLFLTVARLADHKGHRFLLDAIPQIIADTPEARFAFAGDGQLWESLRAQTRRLGITQYVQFLGYRDDVPDLLAAADYFVVPSHLEGLCSSIIDAMLHRVPIVATTAGGIPDLLDPQTDNQLAKRQPCAWLVPPADAGALANGIRNAIQFPTLTQQHAQAAWHRAMSRFTAQAMVDRTVDVFHQRLGRPILQDRSASG